ncbi:MAG: tail fiber domain-containing protein, partial [Bacteroidota bacterium]
SGIYIGKNAGSNISSGPGSNVIIGSSTSANTAAEGSVGVGAGSVVNDFSVAIGGSSGASDFGVASGYFASADFESVAIGTLAGGGFLSVSMGYRALNVGTGAYNIAIGHTAMEQNISGYHNVAVGGYALGGNTSGYDNVAIGLSSLAAFGGSSHSNTSVGSRALINLNAGTYNTAVGVDANTSIGTLDNVTLLGANTVAFSNNSVRVGDTNVSSIGGFEDWTNFSDGRFKHQVEENVPGLDFVMALRPVTYQLNIPELRREMGQEETYYNPEKETIRQTGFIAQEVEQTAQDLGYSFSGVDRPEEESDGFYGLRYATFTVPLVKAVQEQQDLIDQLLQKIEALEARIETLENE